jgi:hypothetical protein
MRIVVFSWAAALLLLGGLRAPCQTASAATAKPQIPTNIAYEFFFGRVLFLDSVADKRESQGRAAGRRAFRVKRRLA